MPGQSLERHLLLPLDQSLWILAPPLGSGFAALLSFTVLAATAAPSSIAQAGIDCLLDFVEHSGCEFNRNGTWYDSKGARAHLQAKYEILKARHRVKTAEDFIESAATRSSVSVSPYRVRCSGDEAIASSQWLRSALDRYRTRAALGSPGVLAPDEVSLCF